jgi:hypothetical protein
MLKDCRGRTCGSSRQRGGFQVFAEAGTNTVSFGIDFEQAALAGLMGVAASLRLAQPKRRACFQLDREIWAKLTEDEAGKDLQRNVWRGDNLGSRGEAGAGCRIRTRDLRFTKPLLYQLS